MTKDLLQAGFSLAALQVAGGWASPQMPGHYGRKQTAEHGAVAQWYAGGISEDMAALTP